MFDEVNISKNILADFCLHMLLDFVLSVIVILRIMHSSVFETKSGRLQDIEIYSNDLPVLFHVWKQAKKKVAKFLVFTATDRKKRNKDRVEKKRQM